MVDAGLSRTFVNYVENKRAWNCTAFICIFWFIRQFPVYYMAGNWAESDNFLANLWKQKKKMGKKILNWDLYTARLNKFRNAPFFIFLKKKQFFKTIDFSSILGKLKVSKNQKAPHPFSNILCTFIDTYIEAVPQRPILLIKFLVENHTNCLLVACVCVCQRITVYVYLVIFILNANSSLSIYLSNTREMVTSFCAPLRSFSVLVYILIDTVLVLKKSFMVIWWLYF